MELVTFRARSLAEALRLVRQELGPDASVLHTRQVGSGLARWWNGRTIEVTASAELEAPSRLPAAAVAGENGLPPAELLDFRRKFREDLLAAGNEPSLVEQLARQSSRQRCSTLVLQQRLASAGISAANSARWLAQLEAELTCDPEAHAERATQRLLQIVAAELPICGPICLAESGPTIVALVGPTGVGKTTTLAKLAAHFRLREQRRVAFVTVDTFRVAAAEQLRTYAQILESPLEVAAAPPEVRAAVERLSEHDLILIDTPGRSPHDAELLAELRELLIAAGPHEVLLVLSCVGDAQSLRRSARAFARVGASSLILTKLDEVAQLGQLPDWLAACRLPLSYTTGGQHVPNDIQPASAARLAELLISNH